MEKEFKIHLPYQVKASDKLTVGFLLSVFFCSKIKHIERKIIYIFYMSNRIPHQFLKYNGDKINKEFLLNLIFELSGSRKLVSKLELRIITGLEDKGTFNKYFNPHLQKINLLKRKSFTLRETFEILQFWQGDDKWGRMRAFTKGELANRFTNGNYDDLEIKMTNEVLDNSFYNHHDYIKPADTKKLINSLLEKQDLINEYEREFSLDYLEFFFVLYLLTLKFTTAI